MRTKRRARSDATLLRRRALLCAAVLLIVGVASLQLMMPGEWLSPRQSDCLREIFGARTTTPLAAAAAAAAADAPAAAAGGSLFATVDCAAHEPRQAALRVATLLTAYLDAPIQRSERARRAAAAAAAARLSPAATLRAAARIRPRSYVLLDARAALHTLIVTDTPAQLEATRAAPLLAHINPLQVVFTAATSGGGGGGGSRVSTLRVTRLLEQHVLGGRSGRRDDAGGDASPFEALYDLEHAVATAIARVCTANEPVTLPSRAEFAFETERERALADAASPAADAAAAAADTTNHSSSSLAAAPDDYTPPAYAFLAAHCTQSAKARAELFHFTQQLSECEAEAVVAADDRRALEVALAAAPSPLPLATVAYFCPPPLNDTRAWQARRTQLSFAAGLMGDAHAVMTDANEQDEARQPRWYCDKLATNLRPWSARAAGDAADAAVDADTGRDQPDDAAAAAAPLALDEISVGVYTGENVFYSRAMAVADTWLRRLPSARIYAASSNAWVPVRGLRDAAGYGHVREMHVDDVQLYGLKDMARSFPRAKWFYIVGCDTYLNVDYLHRMLALHDETRLHWLVPGVWPHAYGVPVGFNTTQWLPTWRMGRRDNTFWWSSGAFGWILSRTAARAFADALDDFERAGLRRVLQRQPDVKTGLVLSMLGFTPTKLAPHWAKGMLAYAVDSKITNGFVSDEAVLMHYVWPRKMLAAHQRATHEKLDRLLNARNASRVVAFARDFIDDHFAILRRKQSQVAHLADALHGSSRFRKYDIEFAKERMRELGDEMTDW